MTTLPMMKDAENLTQVPTDCQHPIVLFGEIETCGLPVTCATVDNVPRVYMCNEHGIGTLLRGIEVRNLTPDSDA